MLVICNGTLLIDTLEEDICLNSHNTGYFTRIMNVSALDLGGQAQVKQMYNGGDGDDSGIY